MKSTTIEPGMLRMLQLSAIIVMVLMPFVRRLYTTTLGISAPFEHYLIVMLPGAILLNAYVWLPWPRTHLKQAFLPIGIGLFAAVAIVEKQLSISWLSPISVQELAVLLLTLRIWLTFQVVVLVVAWQYRRSSVLVVALGLTVFDWALSMPWISSHSTLFPIFLLMTAARIFTILATGLVMGWLLAREREQRRALAEANRKLALAATTAEQLAVSQERNRMARELHDTLAHSLSGVTVQLEAVDALWEVNPTQARAMVNQALYSTRNGLTEARRALQALRATPLEDLGLTRAISNLAEDMAVRTGLKLELSVPARLEDIPPDVEQCVYRITQEALTNVVRHAQAHSVRVILQQTPDLLTLKIADDGRGFNLDADQHNNALNSTGAHFGLKGLRERAQMVGGNLNVDSNRNQGTTLQFTIAV